MFMALTSVWEDKSSATVSKRIWAGRNTANDFYQTLADVQGRPVLSGYGAKWSWLNAYFQAAYTYSDLFRVAVKRLHRRCLFDGCHYDKNGCFPRLPPQ